MKLYLGIAASFVLFFAFPAFSGDEQQKQTEEHYIEDSDIVYAEIICEPKRDLYKILPYHFSGGRMSSKEDIIQSLKREKKTNYKLKYFSEKNTGFFINGEIFYEPKIVHECNLLSGVKVNTSIDFNKPFVTNVERNHDYTKYTLINSPIEVGITKKDKILVNAHDIFKLYSLKFSKNNLVTCYPYENNSSCRYSKISELLDSPLSAVGGWSLDINNQ